MVGERKGKKNREGGEPSGLNPQPGTQSASTDDSCLLPESTMSTMTVEELQSIRSRYGIPDGFQLLIPDSESRVDNPPEGCVAVYEEYLRAGLRFPLDDFFRNLLNFYNLSLGQLVPNSIRIVVGFFLVCDLANIHPRMGLFRPKFVLRRHSQSKGWWMFATREGRFLPDLPSSIHGWKDKFFYVSHSASSSSVPSWGFPSVWVEPKTSSNRDKGIASQDKEDFKLLEDVEVPVVRDLITDQSLYDAGIGPAPRGKSS